MNLSHKSAKKDRIAAELADAGLELKYLKEIYSKMAGESPALDVSTDLTKEQLLAAISLLTKPIPEPATPTVVAAIPSWLEPGQKVWCTATNSEWIGADPSNGIFPSLPPGLAWPVIGYREYIADISYVFASEAYTLSTRIHKNTLLVNDSFYLSSPSGLTLRTQSGFPQSWGIGFSQTQVFYSQFDFNGANNPSISDTVKFPVSAGLVTNGPPWVELQYKLTAYDGEPSSSLTSAVMSINIKFFPPTS